MIKLPYTLGVIIPLKNDLRANNPPTKNLRANKFVIRNERHSFSPSEYEEKMFPRENFQNWVLMIFRRESHGRCLVTKKNNNNKRKGVFLVYSRQPHVM